MLQLIGWLGCVYLVVKALGFAADKNLRNDEGKLKEEAMAAIWIGWLAAIGFAIAFLMQGSAATEGMPNFGMSASAPSPGRMTPEEANCVNSTPPSGNILDCLD